MPRERSRDRDYDRKRSKKSKKRESSSDDDSDDYHKRRDHHRHHSDSDDDHHRHRYDSDDSDHRRRDRDTDSKHKHSHHHKHKSKHKKSSKESRRLTEQEVMTLKEERKREKELVKAMETPQEKRARRLEKKEAKDRKRKANMGWDGEYMGYTNADNPFGDEHLWDTFVWSKKLEDKGQQDMEFHEIEKMQKKKMMENKMELEKVKKRRLEREKERQDRDDERDMMQREKEAEYFKTWEEQEDTFHLQQAKLRSDIRIKDSRAKPIDLLAKYINMDEDDFSVEMHEAYTYLNGLTISDLDDLLEDISVYLELEQGQNADYWRDITIIAEDELHKLRKLDQSSREYIGERRSGMNQAVEDDVHKIFAGKTANQLNLLEESIKKKLRGGEGVDVGYWESLLQQLKAHMARSRLRDRHAEQLRRKLFRLKQEQGINESEPLFPILKQERNTPSPHTSTMTTTSQSQPSTSAEAPPIKDEPTNEEAGPSDEDAANKVGRVNDNEEEESSEEEEAVLTEDDIVDQSVVDYESGQYSPRLLTVNDLEPDTLVYDPEEDIKRLEYARILVIKTGQAQQDSDYALMKKAREGMTDEEATFSVEVSLDKQSFLWSDKYRPRKPRFFNRVHTGFEWNKYNQTHYDMDNPPPKIVQGYKFNIFYPDLIDKTKPPEYVLTPNEDNPDFATLRFKAGPPYEDIAFKIVNREWEYSYKRGFRCQFQNNIFQLWYHFKRFRYRR